jgi:hypothetical protein
MYYIYTFGYIPYFCIPKHTHTHKVIPVLKHHTIKTYGVMQVKLHVVIPSVLDRGRTAGACWLGDWVDTTAGLDMVAKRRNICTHMG